MKHLALIAAGSIAAFAAPAQAAELPAVPAPIFATFDGHTAPLAPVAAFGRDDWDDDWRGQRRWRDRDRDWDDRRWDDRGWSGRRGDLWRGNDGRWRCRRADGTTGLLVGAAAGALLGRELDRRGDRTLSTILGAVGGGLLGREVERGRARCR
ncbi:MAG: glycine zipper 2TM domain-containing protein [Erythrobacter sp.]